MLEEDYVIKEVDGQYTVSRPDQKRASEYSNYVSSYASNLILHGAKFCNLPSAEWNRKRDILVTAAVSCSSGQARINIAETLYVVKEVLFDGLKVEEITKQFDLLKRMSVNDIPDVHVYGRVVLTYFIERAALNYDSDQQTELRQLFLQTAASCFCETELYLDDHNFEEEINNAIIGTFRSMVHYVPFPSSIFSIFEALLHTGEIYVDEVLMMLSIYVEYQSATAGLLPATTIAAVEAVMEVQGEDILLPLCLRTLIGSIENGQNVSVRVLEILKDSLFDEKLTSSVRGKYFNAFSKAMNLKMEEGEQVGNELWDVLEMEEISLRAIQQSELSLDSESDQDQLSTAKFLLQKVDAESRELTVTNYAWMSKILGMPSSFPFLQAQNTILEILATVTDNNQYIPESIIVTTIANNVIHPETDLLLLRNICWLFSARIKHSKSAVPSVPSKLEMLLLHRSIDLVDNSVFFEAFTLLNKLRNQNGLDGNSIDDKLLLIAFSRFDAAITSNEEINDQIIEAMSLLACLLPRSAEVNAEAHYVAVRCFLATDYIGVGLKLLQCLPKIEKDLVDAVLTSARQNDARINAQIVTSLQRYPISDIQRERLLRISQESSTDDILSAMENELGEDEPSYSRLSSFAKKLPELIEGHLDKYKVLTIVTLMQKHELKDLSRKPGLICNKETLSALIRMLATAFETKNTDAGNILQSVESIFRFVASYSVTKLPKETLVEDSEVEELLKLLQNSEVSNLQKKIVRELITLLVTTGIISASSTRVIQIQTAQRKKEDPHNLTEVIDQVEKCPAAGLSTSGIKFKEYLKTGTEFLTSVSVRNEDMEINMNQLDKIHDYAYLLSLFVTKGMLKMISGYEALENVALFMTKYSSIVVDIGVEALLGLSSKTLIVFCQIFDSMKAGCDLSSLSCLLEMLVEHRNSERLKLSSDTKELLVKTCSKCVQMCEQPEGFKLLNAEKLNVFDSSLQADSSGFIRFHSCQGLFVAYNKDSTIDVSVLESIYTSTLSKTPLKQLQFDIQNPKVRSFLHTITLVSSETVKAVCTASNDITNTAELRVNLLSFELLAILRRRNGIESFSVAEVIQQLHSQLLSPQDSNEESKNELFGKLDLLGNIYENLILLLSTGHQEAGNTTSALEILTSLLHVKQKAKWKLLVEDIRHFTSLQKIAETFQEEALRSVVAAKLGTSDIQIISTFFSKVLKQRRVSCFITIKILLVIDKVSPTDIAVLLEILNFLADNQDVIKLIDTTLSTFPSITAFQYHVYSSSIMNRLDSRKFDEIYRNNLQTAVKTLLTKTSFESLGSLVQVMSERSKRFSVQTSSDLFRVLLQFPDSLLIQEWNKVIKVLDTKHPSAWLKYVNEILVASLFSQTKSQKLCLKQVLEKLRGDNGDLMEMHFKITKIKEKAKELMRANKESIETGQFFKTWLQAFNLETINQAHVNNITQNQISDSPNASDLSREESLIAVLIVANEHAYGYELTDPQIVSVYLSCGDREDSGLLQQIETGGGKSAIIRLTAVMKVLLHQKNILIATSNLLLAMRDARECSKLASLFNLTVDHNKDRRQYIAGPKSCYKCDIIYVEPSQLAFDILRHEYSQLKTLGDFKPEILLVDEVDSMLIDDSTKSARLTSEIPGMEFLQPIYHRMWNHLYLLLERIFFVQKDGIQLRYFARDRFTEAFEKVQDLQERVETTEDPSELEEFCELIPEDESSVVNFLCDKLRQYLESFLDVDTRTDEESGGSNGIKLDIPHHLRSFVKSQIHRWPLSLLTALSYVENIHYIVKDGLIQPVEFDTSGVIMENQNWSDGVHQFLQVRHNVPFIPESLPTNFLSSVGFFKRFQPKNIFGFTGTCGSAASKNFLKNTYKLQLLEIPSRHSSKSVKVFPDVELLTNSEWISSIMDSVLLETKKCRGVMVFCRTIKQAEDIYRRLQEVMPANKVKLYAKNSVEEERKIEKIQAEEVIVVTNLAGRGTDVKTNAVIERNGGLHLCVTFIPKTQRAEDQIIGRTARLENNGTVEFILFNPEKIDSSSGTLRLQREVVEEKTLEELSRVTLPPILLKDEMFQAFCEDLKIIRHEVSGSVGVKQRFKGFLRVKIPSAFEKGVVSCVEEGWAYFVREMESDFQKSDASFEQMQEKWMTKFHEVVQKDIEKKLLQYFQTNPKLVVEPDNQSDEEELANDTQLNKKTDLITNPYYAVRIGNELAKDRYFAEALMYYDRAITLEDKLAAGAHIGRARCIVAHRERDHKNKAIAALEDALKCLAEERSVLESTYDATADNSEQTLQAQVLSTISLIGNHINSVCNDLQTIIKSKRLVDISQLKPSSQLDFIRVERKNNILHEETTNSGNYLYEVTFHDLILENPDDPTEKDQLILVAEKFSGKEKQVILPMADASLFHKFVAKRIVHERLTKDEALATLGFSWYERLQNKTMKNPEDHNVNCTINFENPSQSPSIWLINVSRTKVWTTLTEATDNCSSVDVSFENSQTRELLNDSKFNVTLLAVDCERLKKAFQIFRRIESKEESSFALRVSGPFGSLDYVYNRFDGRKVELFYVDEDAPSTVERVLHKVEQNVKPVGWEHVRSIQVAIEESEVDLFKEAKNLLLDVCVTSINADHLEEFLLIQRSMNGKVDIGIFVGLESSFSKVVRVLREAKFELDLKFSGLTYQEAGAAVESKLIKSEQIEAKGVRNVMDSYSNGHYPPSLHLLIGRGLEVHLHLNERIFVPWLSVCTMASLSAAQIMAGSLLFTTGVGAVVGVGLISEGCFDLIKTYRAYSTRQFNWKAYSIQKSLSVGISCASMGLGAAIHLGNIPAEVVVLANMKFKTVQEIAQKSATSMTSLVASKIGMGVAEAAARVGVFAAANKVQSSLFTNKSEATISDKHETSMTKLTGQKIGMGVAETTARVVVFSAADTVDTFLTDHLESGIKDSLTREFGHRAVQVKDNEDHSLLSVLNRLEILFQVLHPSWTLRDKVDSILDDITQSSSSGWQETLVAAGVMVGQKVAGNVGVPLNKNASLGGVAMFLAMVKGLSELVTLCDFIFSKLTKELIRYEQKSFSLESAISIIIKLDPNEGAEAIASATENAVCDENESHCPHPLMFFDVTYNHPGSVEVVKNISVSETDCRTSGIKRHEIFGYLIKIGEKMKLMNELQQKQKDWRSVRCLEEVHCEIAKLIVDKLSEQLTGVVRKNLMNPAIAIAGSSLVNVASTYLQQKFIIDKSECSPEQFENEKKYDLLVAQKLEGSALSATENEFIESYGKEKRIRTTDDQMRIHTEYQMKMRNLIGVAGTVRSRSKYEVQICLRGEVVISEKYAEAVKNGKKIGGLLEVKHLLEKCGVPEGVIICDGSFEETASKFIVKYSTSLSDASGKQPPVMVFTVTKNGAVVIENVKCGFEVVEKITGVKTDQLRSDMFQDILENKGVMARKLSAEDAWLRSGGLEGHSQILNSL